MGVKIREFRGLKTYIDSADIDEGYLNTFKNIRTFPGYAESVQLSAISEDFVMPLDGTLILIDYVFFDEDRLKNYYNNDNTLVYNYEQRLERYRIVIVYGDNQNTTGYNVYLQKQEGDEYIFAGVHTSDIQNQYPYVINEKGIVKLLFKEQTYWLGKINRTRWLADDANNVYQYYDAGSPFGMYPLVFTLDKTPGWAAFEKIDGGSFQTGREIDVSRWVWYDDDHSKANHFIYGWHNKYEFFTGEGEDEQRIYVDKGQQGYMWAFRISNNEGNTTKIAILANQVALFAPEPVTVYPTGSNQYPQLRKANWGGYYPWSYRFGGERKDWESGEADIYVWDRIGHSGDAEEETVYHWVNQITEYRPADVVGEVGIPPEYPYSEYIMTYRVDNNEYPVKWDTFYASTTDKYVIKLHLDVTAGFPHRKVEAMVLYARYAANKYDIKNKDYEQFATIPLYAKERPLFDVYLTELSLNGIFLTQTAGKAIDVDTYKIETAFDDYINVNGVPFILKNGNVLYPSVGNGIVHSDMFYPENYVPQVDGKYLSVLENKLAVFAENREEMTLIDFQPVEGQLAFFIRGSASYKIKNYWDLIETAEGNIISLRDGIYVDNGETRKLISYPINDIIKANYNSSSICYNSYEKEIIYICAVGIYLFRFETESWTQIDLEGLTLEFDTGGGIKIKEVGLNGNSESVELIDIIDDYNGNLYFILSNNKVYKLGYTAAVGMIGLDNVDFGDMTFMKRLNWVGCNAEGTMWLKAYGKEVEPDGIPYPTRTTKIIDTPLLARIPSEEIEFLLRLNGILYNVELGIEAYPSRKL